jgi:hypothetical protein
VAATAHKRTASGRDRCVPLLHKCIRSLDVSVQQIIEHVRRFSVDQFDLKTWMLMRQRVQRFHDEINGVNAIRNRRHLLPLELVCVDSGSLHRIQGPLELRQHWPQMAARSVGEHYSIGYFASRRSRPLPINPRYQFDIYVGLVSHRKPPLGGP